MEQIEVRFADGTTRLYPPGTLKELLPARRRRSTVAARLDGQIMDLRPLERGIFEWILSPPSKGSRSCDTAPPTLWPSGQSLSQGQSDHQACIRRVLLRLRRGQGFSPEDFDRIEAKMKEIVARDLPIVRRLVSRMRPSGFFAKRRALQVELIEELPDSRVTLYQQGDFIDLCRGPHLSSTGKIKAFKLTSVAGAYWRGDERNKMLQRIYGTAFPTAGALEKHLFLLEEAPAGPSEAGTELTLLHQQEGAGWSSPSQGRSCVRSWKI
jgi:threonyl-tRNA synthetase